MNKEKNREIYTRRDGVDWAYTAKKKKKKNEKQNKKEEKYDHYDDETSSAY